MYENNTNGYFMSEEYELYIEYKENDSTYNIFKNVASLMLAIDNFNNAIATSFGNDIETQVSIVEISSGSIRMKLIDTISKIPDEKIKSYINNPKEILVDILIISKKKMLDALDKGNITIEKELPKEIEKTIISSGLSDYGYSINKTRILESVGELSQSAEKLKATVKIDNEDYTINSSYKFDPENIEDIQKRTSTTRQKFIIKKPDLVGDSKWTVIFDKNIDVKILDDDWMKKLKNRDFSISYGDMIDAELKIDTFIDENLHVIETKYYINKIYGIVNPS